MDPAIAQRLIGLNRAFYETFAVEFSGSRERLNEGILRCFEGWPRVRALVDLGCGDARVGDAWASGRLACPWIEGTTQYLGVDNAPALLRARAFAPRTGWDLLELDLVERDWSAGIEVPEGAFSHAVCFSALHHLPGRESRDALVRGMRSLLAPRGAWALSVWQILHTPRFRERVGDWSQVGIDEAELEPGDLLVDWRRGGRGWRYVHHFDENELVELLQSNGLCVDSVWRSDGRSGDLGLYCRGTAAG